MIPQTGTVNERLLAHSAHIPPHIQMYLDVRHQTLFPLERLFTVIAEKRLQRRMFDLMPFPSVFRWESPVTSLAFKVSLPHMHDFVMPQHLVGVREFFAANAASRRRDTVEFLQMRRLQIRMDFDVAHVAIPRLHVQMDDLVVLSEVH